MQANQLAKARARIAGKVLINKSTGCWDWDGSPRENGYCRTSFFRVNWYVHRASYAAFVGKIEDGMDVCHTCDNRKCCNPDHLFVGSRKDNMQDAVSKGRQAKGFMLPHTKLSESDIESIIARAKSGETYKSIALFYNVTPQTAGRAAIKKGFRQNEHK